MDRAPCGFQSSTVINVMFGLMRGQTPYGQVPYQHYGWDAKLKNLTKPCWLWDLSRRGNPYAEQYGFKTEFLILTHWTVSPSSQH